MISRPISSREETFSDWKAIIGLSMTLQPMIISAALPSLPPGHAVSLLTGGVLFGPLLLASLALFGVFLVSAAVFEPDFNWGSRWRMLLLVVSFLAAASWPVEVAFKAAILKKDAHAITLPVFADIEPADFMNSFRKGEMTLTKYRDYCHDYSRLVYVHTGEKKFCLDPESGTPLTLTSADEAERANTLWVVQVSAAAERTSWTLIGAYLIFFSGFAVFLRRVKQVRP